MQLDLLMTLLAKERNRRGQSPGQKPLNEKQVNHIRFKGIPEEEIVNFVVPRLIQWEIDGDFSKENLSVFLSTSPEIHTFPNPIRHEIDKTTEQRRMDSLSRLLSVNSNITPCIAVAFYEKELIVASNSPNGKTDEDLADYFVQKMAVIREFLLALAKDLKPTQNPEGIAYIQFSTRAKLLAEKAIRSLVAENLGGTGGLLPKKEKKYINTSEHLKNALLKVGRAYLLGLYTNGTKGFSQENIQALFSDPITIVTPNKFGLGKVKLHAEQAIIYYLTHVHKFETKTSTRKINIGISKLCCQSCTEVLSRRAEKVSFRGSHGVAFSDIFDIDNGSVFNCIPTQKNTDVDLCAPDSESECEFYEEEDALEDEAIPSLDELRARPPSPSYKIKGHEQHMLFKFCGDKAGDEDKIHDMGILTVTATS